MVQFAQQVNATKVPNLFCFASNIKIMVGECNDRLAMRILTEVSHGRGGMMSTFTVDNILIFWFFNCLQSFTQELTPEVHLIRPMRQVSCREIAFFNHFKSVSPLVWRRTDTGVLFFEVVELTAQASSKTSFDRLTEEFVAGLVVCCFSTCIGSTLNRLDFRPLVLQYFVRLRKWKCQQMKDLDSVSFVRQA